MFEADKSYPVTIEDVYLTVSKVKGTDGLFFSLKGEEGDITHTEWLTAARRDQFVKTMNALGVSSESLADEAFWSEPRALLAGKPARIVTKADEYNGKTRVIVAFLNGPTFIPPAASAEAISRVARLFDDVPF